MDEQRKYAILFAATILAARKLNPIGSKPSPAREFAITDAIEKANRILEKIDERWPAPVTKSQNGRGQIRENRIDSYDSLVYSLPSVPTIMATA